MDSMVALLIAWFVGAAAIERFDKGDVEVAYFLGAVSLICLIAWIVGRDDA